MVPRSTRPNPKTAMFETAWITEPFELNCQDRVAVFAEADRSVIVVADGAGGTSGGGQAAATILDAVRRAVAATGSPEDWCRVLHQIDGQIGPGESTAAVVDVRADDICGASVGDSQAW